ncbi:MAG TPA: hypothetical protein VF003_16035 [Pseudonocardiaceae bacterium]
MVMVPVSVAAKSAGRALRLAASSSLLVLQKFSDTVQVLTTRRFSLQAPQRGMSAISVRLVDFDEAVLPILLAATFNEGVHRQRLHKDLLTTHLKESTKTPSNG